MPNAQMTWTATHPQATVDMLGFIPEFFHPDDPRKAVEQINDRYAHGGGWSPLKGFTMNARSLSYPDDPPLMMIAEAKLRDETIRVYSHTFVAIVQADGTFEVARLD